MKTAIVMKPNDGFAPSEGLTPKSGGDWQRMRPTMPKKEIQILEDVELYLEGIAPCDCGEPDCLTCMAQQLKEEYKNKINSKGNHQMQSTKNQQIAENFVHGPEYLNQWQKNTALREEFDGDFEAYCHYQAAYSKGLVKTFGGRR